MTDNIDNLRKQLQESLEKNKNYREVIRRQNATIRWFQSFFYYKKCKETFRMWKNNIVSKFDKVKRYIV